MRQVTHTERGVQCSPVCVIGCDDVTQRDNRAQPHNSFETLTAREHTFNQNKHKAKGYLLAYFTTLFRLPGRTKKMIIQQRAFKTNGSP